MIVTELFSGFGNQMWQYAAGLCLARRHGTRLRIDNRKLLHLRQTPPYRNYDMPVFDGDFRIASRLELLSVGHVPNRLRGHLGGRLLQRLLPGRGVFTEAEADFATIPDQSYITGYWQRLDCLAGVEDELRRTFRSQAQERLIAQTPLFGRMANSRHPVCVSIRRGDYVGLARYDTLCPDYYAKARQLLENRLGEQPDYFVFSDDIDWCKENLHWPGRSLTFADSQLAGEGTFNHFFLMRHARHFIIPNSTYHWWAAWLADAPDKLVVAPRRWNTAQTRDVHPCIPPGWLTL